MLLCVKQFDNTGGDVPNQVLQLLLDEGVGSFVYFVLVIQLIRREFYHYKDQDQD